MIEQQYTYSSRRKHKEKETKLFPSVIYFGRNVYPGILIGYSLHHFYVLLAPNFLYVLPVFVVSYEK